MANSINKSKEVKNNTIKVYYLNQFTSYYKSEEKELQKIVDNYIKSQKPDIKIKLLLYLANIPGWLACSSKRL